KMEDGSKLASDAATELAQEKDVGSEAYAHMTLAEISREGGSESTARAEIEKARHLADSTSDPTLKLRVAVTQATIDTLWGNAAAAVGLLKGAEKDALKSWDVALSLRVRVALGEAQYKAGKMAEAQATLSSAGRDARTKG